MGARGPIGKPTAIKELEGNPGRRPLNPNEPKPKKVESVSPPAWLNDVAKVYWHRVVPILSNMGVLTEADLPILERYCDFLADWRHCRDFLANAGQIWYPIYDGERLEPDGRRTVKYMQEFPHVAKKIRLSEHLLKIETHFGMTPAARSRITNDELYGGSLGTEPQDDDPFDPSVN